MVLGGFGTVLGRGRWGNQFSIVAKGRLRSGLADDVARGLLEKRRCELVNDVALLPEPRVRPRVAATIKIPPII